MPPILKLITGVSICVVVILFSAFYQIRLKRWLRIRIKFDRSVVRGKGDSLETIPYIEFVALNQGTPDIVLQNWGIQVAAGSKVFFSLDLGDQTDKNLFSPNLPKRLSPGDTYTCGIPKRELTTMLSRAVQKGTIQSHDHLVVEFIDSFGKKYRKIMKKSIQELMDEAREMGPEEGSL